MEYILFLTYRCNLNCSYCFAKKYVHQENNYSLRSEDVKKLCEYIENDIKLNNRKNNSIVFFGGEPSLVPDIILDIIHKTSHLDLKYSIYTNGLLLDKLPKILINQLDSILVAIDGDKRSHEIFKPKGSYEQIIKNVRLIRKETSAQVIARITMEESTNIFDSVTNLLPEFDFVHWQIVNKDSFINPIGLVNDYKVNVEKLFNFWKKSLKSGVVLNIIPFNRIVLSILTNEKNHSFRCGCGSTIQAIDIWGNLYLCDEYIDSKNNIIGNISDGEYGLINYKSHIDLFDDCRYCNISSMCLGRCRKLLETQKKDHIRIYCELSKILINLISGSIDEIKSIINYYRIDLSSLQTEIYNTEIIP